MSQDDCSDVQGDWIVGSHACLTVAKAMRSPESKALNENQVVLYRLIGNDMPPLESLGQLSMNTLYALENEPKDLWNLKRRWILNRVFDQDQHDEITTMLRENGYDTDDILDISLNEDVLCSMPNAYEKLLYLTNQNGARNAAYVSNVYIIQLLTHPSIHTHAYTDTEKLYGTDFDGFLFSMETDSFRWIHGTRFVMHS
jgi:hypothetical protein